MKKGRFGVWLVLVTLAVALAACCWDVRAAREGASGNQAVRGAGLRASAGEAGAALWGGPLDADVPVRETASNRFLDDVARVAEAAPVDEMGVRSACVQWREERDVPQVAADVLRMYEQAPGAQLVTSGYVDLHGDVWCALVQRQQAWVDVVMVATGDGAASEARVMRSARCEER